MTSPATLVASPTKSFFAIPTPPFAIIDPELTLVASVVPSACIEPLARILPATSKACVGLVLFTPTCPCELTLNTVVVCPWLFNLKSISSSNVLNWKIPA